MTPNSMKDIVVKGAREHNLQNIDVTIPRDQLVVITGLSGSGKSSFVNEILYKKLAAELNGAKTRAGAFDAIEGLEYLSQMLGVQFHPEVDAECGALFRWLTRAAQR